MSLILSLTAPTCAGKTYLYDHLKQKLGYPSLISTTTRPPRHNEVDGRDYFFISKEQSDYLTANNLYIERAEFNGAVYGVTVEEFQKKTLNNEITIFICDPQGVKPYQQIAEIYGIDYYKVWIQTPLEIRLERHAKRSAADARKVYGTPDFEKALDIAFKRQQAMTLEETSWFNRAKWDLILDGQQTADFNTEILKKYLYQKIESPHP